MNQFDVYQTSFNLSSSLWSTSTDSYLFTVPSALVHYAHGGEGDVQSGAVLCFDVNQFDVNHMHPIILKHVGLASIFDVNQVDVNHKWPCLY